MEKILLTNIISIKYIKKVNKYLVELGVDQEKKRTVWLSEKQIVNLNNCFDKTKNGYSNKNVSVYGHWNDNGFYAFTTVEYNKNPKRFKEPYQYDLSDLQEVD